MVIELYLKKKKENVTRDQVECIKEVMRGQVKKKRLKT